MIGLPNHRLSRKPEQPCELIADFEKPPIEIFDENDGLTVGQQRLQARRGQIGPGFGCSLPLSNDPSCQPTSADEDAATYSLAPNLGTGRNPIQSKSGKAGSKGRHDPGSSDGLHHAGRQHGQQISRTSRQFQRSEGIERSRAKKAYGTEGTPQPRCTARI